MKLNLSQLYFKKNRNNVPSESVPDYFKKVVTIPLLGQLLTQLNVRFDSASIIMYGGLVIVPVKMLPLYRKKLIGGKSLDPLQIFI